jgi:hypothetical protein
MPKIVNSQNMGIGNELEWSSLLRNGLSLFLSKILSQNRLSKKLIKK